jgi:hypothetical protein
MAFPLLKYQAKVQVANKAGAFTLVPSVDERAYMRTPLVPAWILSC